MEIMWTTVFIDLGADVFEDGMAFWSSALHSDVSRRRGSSGEFATLVPADGDAYVRVQRTNDGSSGIHLDLHVKSPAAVRSAAVSLGAHVIADHGTHVLIRSPAGMRFCFVEHRGESMVPAPTGPPLHRLDQLCIDIGPDLYDQECSFWESLTGWKLSQSQLPEFRLLAQPNEMPLRFLLQRLDSAPAGGKPHAHLDVACGEHIDAMAELHRASGATQLGRTKRWMQMRDPAGLLYCLTPRDAAVT